MDEGDEDERPMVEAGSPTLEHAVFVTLGIIVTLVILVHVISLFLG